ncbi:hypothetical protein [Lentzea terrae]|uniref:hypothetical protein n=1 Tax=Lentzea terrae TaxID=2200761 RepID=UPI000DD376B1|nr:hypothetical protein [Lentzea terrae]
MRKIALMLAGCLALTGCAGTWEAEIRLKVTKIEDYQPLPEKYPAEVQVWLDPVGELPSDAYDRENFTGKIVEPAEIDGDVQVGDEVVCLAKQRTIGALQTNSISTELFQCRKA